MFLGCTAEVLASITGSQCLIQKVTLAVMKMLLAPLTSPFEHAIIIVSHLMSRYTAETSTPSLPAANPVVMYSLSKSKIRIGFYLDHHCLGLNKEDSEILDQMKTT